MEPRYDLANTEAGSPSQDPQVTKTLGLDAATQGPAELPVGPRVPQGDDAGMVDVAPPVDAVDDAIEEFPLGQYAVVARFYGRAVAAVGGWFGEQSIALLDVQRTAGQLQANWKTCDFSGRFVLGVIPDTVYRVVRPDLLPERTLQLVVDGRGFSMFGGPVPGGYEPLQDCSAASAKVYTDRPWLPDGRCTCSGDPSPPTTATDCRVIDSDGDGAPGFAMRSTGGFDNVANMRMYDGSNFVSGLIAADGKHTAQLQAAFDTYRLSCDHEPCMVSGGQLCPLGHNPTRFTKLSRTSTP
ncbi:MAG TPA: hypothetical protein VI299_08680, partial [Polyangiales bacterium]